MTKSIVIIFGILQVYLGLADALGNTFAMLQELQKATTAMEAKNILNFGDSCNTANEKKREAVGKQLIDSLTKMDESQIGIITKEMKGLSALSGNFCNSLKNLQCQSNGKCGCANAEINGIRMTSVREGSNCRLDRGSACVPPEALESLGSKAPDLKCKTSTSCQLKSDRSVCTQAQMTQEITRSYTGNKSDMNAFRTHILKKMKDGLCLCN